MSAAILAVIDAAPACQNLCRRVLNGEYLHRLFRQLDLKAA
jgi:hypothetical protein